MADVTFFDTSVRRESNCPVHFVWDGNGAGRPVVRVGFMLLLVAGALLTAGLMAPGLALAPVGRWVGLLALGTWALGQVLTKVSVSRAR